MGLLDRIGRAISTGFGAVTGFAGDILGQAVGVATGGEFGRFQQFPRGAAERLATGAGSILGTVGGAALESFLPGVFDVPIQRGGEGTLSETVSELQREGRLVTSLGRRPNLARRLGVESGGTGESGRDVIFDSTGGDPLPLPISFRILPPTSGAAARGATMAAGPATALPGGAPIQLAGFGDFGSSLIGGLAQQFLPSLFGGGGPATGVQTAMAGEVQLFRPTLTSIRPNPLVMVRHPQTGAPVFFKHAGRPILFSGDLRAAKLVRRLARRARRATGGR